MSTRRIRLKSDPDALVDVTVVTPCAPEHQNHVLARAVRSVRHQQAQPVGGILIEVDDLRRGPAVIRNGLVDNVATEWVAFLDADDELHPDHLHGLVARGEETGADLVWSWARWEPSREPSAERLEPPPWLERQRDPAAAERYEDLERANWIPVVVLARADMVRRVGGFPTDPGDMPRGRDEDWGLWLRLRAAGARFAMHPATTWTYHASAAGRNRGA